MGWTFTNRPIGLSHQDFFSQKLNWEGGRVLDAAGIGFTQVYLAFELLDRATGESREPREVIAVACKIKWRKSNDGYNFGYKCMDETMGPLIARCPQRILELLTPTDDERARQWREACWNTIRRRKERPKLQPGDVVLFSETLHFSGVDRRILEVVPAGRKLRFAEFPVSDSSPQRYRVYRRNLDGAMTISSPNPRMEMKPSPHLEALMAERGEEAVGRAHSLVKEHLRWLARLPLRDPERAAENVADLLRATLDLGQEFGEERVAKAYAEIAAELVRRGTRGETALRERFAGTLVGLVEDRLSPPEPGVQPGALRATQTARQLSLLSLL